MQKEDIRIKRVIIHILNPAAGLPVLSDVEMEFGSDFADFLMEHIYKIMSSDDCKKCKFYKKESEVYQLLASYQEDDFVSMSQDIANYLYQIMSSNIDIPPAERSCHDCHGRPSIQAIEKKYEVNGEKTNYFTSLFLKCSSEISHKSKLSVVTKAVEKVQNNYYDEEQLYEENMRTKSIIYETLEDGSFAVEELSDKIFGNDYGMKAEFQESMEKYDLVKQEIAPKNEGTIKKYAFQNLLTDTGIEIKIPMEQYINTDFVEIVREANGSISLCIKNIMHLKAKL